MSEDPNRRPLRLIVYDRSYATYLSPIWAAGAIVYRGLRRHDASYGAKSWADALAWIASYEPDRPIAELEYWGHGKWGVIKIADDRFDAAALAPDHTHAPGVDALRDRLLPNAASLVWLRTCESFGADAGIDFAHRLAHRLRARVAGHTFIIGALQSGLRALEPGKRPAWSANEGLVEGTPAKPQRARESSVLAPRTIHFMTPSFPARWFAEDGA